MEFCWVQRKIQNILYVSKNKEYLIIKDIKILSVKNLLLSLK